jgi:hypothetical protein
MNQILEERRAEGTFTFVQNLTLSGLSPYSQKNEADFSSGSNRHALCGVGSLSQWCSLDMGRMGLRERDDDDDVDDDDGILANGEKVGKQN